MKLRPPSPPAASPPPTPFDVRREAKWLYWQLWRLADIGEKFGIADSTLSSWRVRDKWDEASPIERMEGITEARYVALVNKPEKTGSDYKEIDLLGRQVERFARVRRYQEPGGHEGDLNPAVANRNAGPKKSKAKNYFSPEQVAQLVAAFQEGLFAYQRRWFEEKDQRSRMILKSRQIGATYYFAHEAFIDALETGRNQIFLSASKSQAYIFRQYIAAFAKRITGVELKGDPIVLDRGEGTEPVTLYFLGTNAKTAQGYHGNLYFDEFFWTHGFAELEKVASGMTLHSKWRRTYFSTPSTIQHPAYALWTGSAWNKKKAKADKVDFDVTWANLRDGQVGPDRRWRQIVTITDAKAGGCDLFNLDELRDEYADDAFANLLMCEFVDDAMSVFPLAELAPCMVDAWEIWDDFFPLRDRPYGDRPVWIGYDPSHKGDSAALAILAPPATAGGKFRLLEKAQFRGMDFAAQAEAIREACSRYNVAFIGIDATGLGQGVYQLVKAFYPAARAINYSAEVKNRLVLKAKDTITRRRFEFDTGATDVAQSFMAIRKALTDSGRQSTYEAGRTDETGHADLAWAIMHALDNEPLEAGYAGGASPSFMEFS